MPTHEDAASPVTEGGTEKLEPGIALCLSGGGYRAMLFHVGALWRLNELGLLPRLDRVSSVSGGSITAATLGRRWGKL
jgi:NTE family protein